ncbi:MAG: DUF7551 domain-containing protein [Halovenus sp.]
MIGTTLTDIRDHIEELASEDGQYYIVCGRTRDRPVPADGLSFESRTVARAALRATEQYRAALRRYDPRVPYYDLIVCERAGPGAKRLAHREGDDWELTDPVVTTSAPDRRTLVEFCHRVAAAVFEALSAGGYSTVESAVMDAYFELAETIAEPDELCLRLLESTATELGRHLAPREQASLLASAGSRLPPADAADRPVKESCDELQRSGLVGSYSYSPVSYDRERRERLVVVDLLDYALSERDGRLPVLPFVLDLYRRDLDRTPSELLVEADGEDWRLTIEFSDSTAPAGLVWPQVRSPHS